MNLKPRYLTKSLFTLACECPTKLYYTNKKDEYANRKLEDPFLKGLADGGMQVSALAKLYYPQGKEITTLDAGEALKQTNSYLEQENIVIFEAAIRYDNFFIRTDILVKNGNSIELIEVKAKSYDSSKTQPFLTKKGGLLSKWRRYIQDIAFQAFVFEKAFPHFTTVPYLLLADTQAKCPTDRLNQKFLLQKEDGKVKVVTSPLTEEEISQKILVKVPVQGAVQVIVNNEEQHFSQTFSETVDKFAIAYKNNQQIWSALGSKCAKCEFQSTTVEASQELKSGFKECWTHHLDWNKEDFAQPTVLDLWNYRGKDKLMQQGIYKLADIPEDILKIKKDDKPGMPNAQRQRLQIIKTRDNDNKPEIDLKGLETEIAKLTFPLHFIDFETIQPAIPFHQGRKPYEAIAFQFSHHQIESDGTVHHQGDYLNTDPEFPNYEFVRQLKTHLTQDAGSIFRYSNHENTYLNYIYTQLEEDSNPPDDRQQLQDFIQSISKSSSKRKNTKNTWEGERNMIDLLDWVKRYYYDPRTKGSNSIKHVLPAILNSSSYLQERYSHQNYGRDNEIKGSNFKNFKWVQWENNLVKDPYKLLPKLFDDISDKDMVLLTQEDEISNGTAALTAYAKMQLTEMTKEERTALINGLLQYCELDTLAMVMIFEGWRDWLQTGYVN